MAQTFTAKAEILIQAPMARVWRALTDPELIKQYLFGTEVVTDWQVGSPIVYRGQWQGKAYEDKGQILKLEPERLLVSTYWSSMSGLADVPENYNTVSYELSAAAGGTSLTVTQDNIASEKSRQHSEQNWSGVLQKLKQLLESGSGG